MNISVKTLEQTTKEVTMLGYSKRNERYSMQRMVMTIAAKLKRSYKFFGIAMPITLKDIWEAVKAWYSSLKDEKESKPTVMQLPNISSYYNNKSGSYTGD